MVIGIPVGGDVIAVAGKIRKRNILLGIRSWRQDLGGNVSFVAIEHVMSAVPDISQRGGLAGSQLVLEGQVPLLGVGGFPRPLEAQ